MSKKYTVLITGASRGIGKSIAQFYIDKGHDVLTPTREDIDLERIDEISKNLKLKFFDAKLRFALYASLRLVIFTNKLTEQLIGIFVQKG